MATKTIGTGGDYASIGLWITYLQTIGTLTEPEIGQLLGEDHSIAATTFTSITTSAANYVELTCASGAGHSGISKDVTGGSHARIVTTAQITVSIGHFRIHDIEIKGSGTGQHAGRIHITTAPTGEVRIYNNVMHNDDATSGASNHGIQAADTDVVIKIYRNIIYGYGQKGILLTNGATGSVCYNNTIYSCAVGIDSITNAVWTIKNNASFNNSTSDFNITTGTADYNVSSDATASGANSFTSQVATEYFVNATTTYSAADFTRKTFSGSGSDRMTNTAVNLGSPYDVDITNQTVTGSWDMGADELSATLTSTPSAGTITITGEVPTIPTATASDTVTIGVGGTYTTLATWLSYLQGLGTVPRPQIGQLLRGNHELTTEFTFGTVTTTADNYVELTSDADNRHDGRSSDVSGLDNARISSASTIIISIQHFRMSFIEIRASGTSKNAGRIEISGVPAGSGDVRIHNCIVHGNLQSSGTPNPGIKAADGDPVIRIYRNIVYAYKNEGILLSNGASGSVCYNNTVYGCSVSGISCTSSNFTIKNNACFNNTLDFILTSGTADYNTSSDTSVSGSNNYGSQTATHYFVNATTTWTATDLTRKTYSGSGTDRMTDNAQDQGQLYETDITGFENHTPPAWDRGADEVYNPYLILPSPGLLTATGQDGSAIGGGRTIDCNAGSVSFSGPAPDNTVIGLTYYVKTTGSDSNTGLSVAQAWLTPQKAANTVAPGDTVKIMAGTYTRPSGNNYVLQLSTSGTSLGRITFEDYGDGDVIFDNVNGGVYCIYVAISQGDTPCDYITLNGISVTRAAQYGMNVRNCDYAIIDHCKAYENGGFGIFVSHGGTGAIIQYCESYYNRGTGIKHGDNTNLTQPNLGTIRYCHVHHNYSPSQPGNVDGVHIVGNNNDYGYVGHNVIHDNSDDGMDIGQDANWCIIEYNTVYNNGATTVDGITYRGDGSGIKTGTHGDAGEVDGGHIIRRNIVFNNTLRAYDGAGNYRRPTEYGQRPPPPMLYNNTFIDKDATADVTDLYYMEHMDVILFNNIGYGPNHSTFWPARMRGLAEEPPFPYSNYNLWWGNGTDSNQKYIKDYVATNNAFLTPPEYDANSTYGDPLFVNDNAPESTVNTNVDSATFGDVAGLHLNTNLSPAHDAGININTAFTNLLATVQAETNMPQRWKDLIAAFPTYKTNWINAINYVLDNLDGPDNFYATPEIGAYEYAGSVTLPIDAGSLTISGLNATRKMANTILFDADSDAGLITFTGLDVSVSIPTLSVSYGSLTFTGLDASIVLSLNLLPIDEAGNITITGLDCDAFAYGGPDVPDPRRFKVSFDNFNINNTTYLPDAVTLKCSPFSDDLGLEHIMTHWEIRSYASDPLAAGFPMKIKTNSDGPIRSYSNVVDGTLTKLVINLPTNRTKMKFRVRVQSGGINGMWSEWSEYKRFETRSKDYKRPGNSI